MLPFEAAVINRTVFTTLHALPFRVEIIGRIYGKNNVVTVHAAVTVSFGLHSVASEAKTLRTTPKWTVYETTLLISSVTLVGLPILYRAPCYGPRISYRSSLYFPFLLEVIPS